MFRISHLQSAEQKEIKEFENNEMKIYKTVQHDLCDENNKTAKHENLNMNKNNMMRTNDENNKNSSTILKMLLLLLMLLVLLTLLMLLMLLMSMLLLMLCQDPEGYPSVP